MTRFGFVAVGTTGVVVGAMLGRRSSNVEISNRQALPFNLAVGALGSLILSLAFDVDNYNIMWPALLGLAGGYFGSRRMWRTQTIFSQATMKFEAIKTGSQQSI